MGSREEDDISIRSVKVNPVKSLVPGENLIHDAWVEVSGERVDEILVGQQFDIKVRYTSENTVGSLTNSWMSCVTAKAIGITNYEDTLVQGARVENHEVTLGNMGNNIMPDGVGDLVMTIRLWMRDDVDEAYPPITEW